MKDYINDTFIRLTQEGRIKDAVACCERVAAEAPGVEFRCMALKNLAECHFFMTGDGEACRDANLRGLRLMEEHPEILEGTEHMPREVTRRMYSDFCEQFRSVAVSFEEYEEHCEKPLRVRARNAAEERGLKAVEELKSKNAGWIENMFLLLEQYFPQAQTMTGSAAAAQGSCLAQLILLNRRKLRTKPLDVNFALQQYMNCAVANVEKLIQTCGKNRFPPDGEQLLFLFDRASSIIESFRGDRQADQPTVEKCLEMLAGARTHVEELCERPAVHTELWRAEGRADYLTMDKLSRDFGEEMEALENVRLKEVDVGQSGVTGGPVDPGTDRKLGKFFRRLLFVLIVFAIAWVIWKLNVFSMTR